MRYNLKEKLSVTEEYLNELISKSWQEADGLSQQAANIDTSTNRGAAVARLLKSACTNYYVLIGCLETLAEEAEIAELAGTTTNNEVIPDGKTKLPAEFEAEIPSLELQVATKNAAAVTEQSFEPFEYFVDFDEPSGEPVTDEDLYN